MWVCVHTHILIRKAFLMFENFSNVWESSGRFILVVVNKVSRCILVNEYTWNTHKAKEFQMKELEVILILQRHIWVSQAIKMESKWKLAELFCFVWLGKTRVEWKEKMELEKRPSPWVLATPKEGGREEVNCPSSTCLGLGCPWHGAGMDGSPVHRPPDTSQWA